MKLVIIIPAYNEEKTVGSVISEIPDRISGISEKEIIVIDDGSTDNTAKVARGAGAEVIFHPENKGVGAAFSTGVKEVLFKKADIMVSVDADNQFDPRDIPKLVQPILDTKADFVIGSRFKKELLVPEMSKIKLFGNRLMAKFISWVCGQKFFDVSCGFRAYSKEALLRLNLFGKFTYTQEAILNLSFKDLKMIEVPVRVKYFPDRTSFISGNLIKYVFNAMKIIFRTILDYKPLKIFGGIGIFIFLIGFIFDVWMLSIFLKTGQFTPYKYIGILGLTFNIFGISLLVVGLIADMLNRIRQTQERILYYQKKKFYYGEE